MAVGRFSLIPRQPNVLTSPDIKEVFAVENE